MGLTAAGKRLWLETISGGGPGGTFYAALMVDDGSTVAEVSGGSYARQMVGFLTPDQGIPQNNLPGAITNPDFYFWTRPSGQVEWPIPTAAWYSAGDHIFASLWTASTGGEEVYRCEAVPPTLFWDQPVGTGRPYRVKLDPQWLTIWFTYIENGPSSPGVGFSGPDRTISWTPAGLLALADSFWTGTAFPTLEAAIFGYYDSTDPGGGNSDGFPAGDTYGEATYSGYSRQAIPWDSVDESGLAPFLPNTAFQFGAVPAPTPWADTWGPILGVYGGSTYFGDWGFFATIQGGGGDAAIPRVPADTIHIETP